MPLGELTPPTKAMLVAMNENKQRTDRNRDTTAARFGFVIISNRLIRQVPNCVLPKTAANCQVRFGAPGCRALPTFRYGVGLGAGLGRGLGVTRGLAVGVGLAVAVAVAEAVGLEVGVGVVLAVEVGVGVDVEVEVAVAVAVAVGVDVAVGVGLAVGVGVGVPAGRLNA